MEGLDQNSYIKNLRKTIHSNLYLLINNHKKILDGSLSYQ